MSDLLNLLTRPAKKRRPWLIAVSAGLILALLVWFTLRDFGAEVVRAAWDARGLDNVESWAPEITAAAKESDVDPYLLGGIMYAESRGKVGAVSSASALGLMQLATSSAGDAARKLGLENPTREALLTDGALNVRLGANHVAWLLKHEGPDLERVLVAYNAGRTKVRRWIREQGSWKAWRKERDAAGNSQVLAYARNVLAARDELRSRGRLAVR